MTDGAQRLLHLLEAWTRESPRAPFSGWVTIGVRTQDGFRFWSFSRDARGARSWTEDTPPVGADARLCLTRRDVEDLLAGRAPEADGRRRVVGDPAVLRRFVESYVRRLDALSVRCG